MTNSTFLTEQRRRQLALGLYLLIFLAIRLTNLTDLPVTVDEWRHIIRSEVTLTDGDLFIGMREGFKQLYVWLVAAVLPLFQDHIYAARFISVLAGGVTGLLCYQLGQTLYGSRRIGWLAALIYLISPMALFYDRTALSDTLLTMFTAAGILFSFQLWRQPTFKWAVILGLIFGLGALTKAYAALYYPAPILFWLLLGRDIRWGRMVKLLTVVYGVAFLFWLPIFITGLTIFEEDHAQKLMTTEPAGSWTGTVWNNLLTSGDWFGAYLTWSMIAFFLFSLGWIIFKRDKMGLSLAILIGLNVSTFILILKYAYAKYSLPAIVPISLIIAWGIDQLAGLIMGARQRRPPFTQPEMARWGLALAIWLLLSLPAIRFDYFILFDMPGAPLPAEERSVFVEGRFAGYGLRESAAVVADMARRFPSVIILEGTNQLDTLFSLDVIGMSVYLRQFDNITYTTLANLDAQTLQLLDSYAAQAPTLTLSTFNTEGELLPTFAAPLIDNPQAWPVASFIKPGHRHKVVLYQWLLWPDFALHWLQQGGDADPHLAGPPATDELITAASGTLLPFPQPSDPSPEALHQALTGAGIDYVLVNAELVNQQPTIFAPYVAVEGGRLRFNQPPPDWYLAFAYPDLMCQWCLFYVRPPTHPTQITFGDTAIQLDGYDIAPSDLSAGDPIQLTLFWQALQPPGQSYVVFVHLLDNQGRLVAQVDQQPLKGQWPTQLWQSGHKLADRYTLALNSPLPPGDYTLAVGLYEADTLQRLPVQTDQYPIVDNAVRLIDLPVTAD